MKLVLALLILYGFYCDNLNAITIKQAQRRLRQATETFFGTFQAGLCAQMMLNATVRNRYISTSLIGRVEPVGTFLDTESALEYLYGLLCDIPGLPERREIAESIDILQLTYDANYYRVSFKVQVNLKSGKKVIFFGMLGFNRQWKLCGYEAVIQHFGLTLDFNSTIRPTLRTKLCQGAQILCPVGSPLEQYASFNECISFLSPPQTPFGTYDRADQNNVVCRLIHLQLAQIAPQMHCPHLGKTGGGKCTDKTFHYYFNGTTDFVQCAHQYRPRVEFDN